MCGRVTQLRSRIDYVQALGVDIEVNKWIGGDGLRQFNLPPGSPMVTLHRLRDRELHSTSITWGYRPSWVKEKGGDTTPNARVEGLLTGKYFRHMLKSGRVLVPIDGWFEWTGEKPNKQPYYIRYKSHEPIFAAGLTNLQPDKQQTVEIGVVLVTAAADAGLVELHGRAPIVLARQDALHWIDPDMSAEEAQDLILTRARPGSDFEYYPVSKAVNRPRPMHEIGVDECNRLIEPISLPPGIEG